MPLLPLERWGTEQAEWAWLDIFAVMIYPDEGRSRERREFIIHMCAKLISAGVEHPNPDTKKAATSIGMDFLVRGGLRFLQGSPSWDKVLKKWQHDSRPGQIAGGLLMLIMLLEQHNLQGSLGKAVHIWKRYPSSVFSDRRNVPESPGALYKAWTAYKPVVHLWAAYRALVGSGRHFPNFTEEVIALLSLSEAYRKFGEQYIPHARSTPLLPPEAVWRVPGGFPTFHVQWAPPRPLTEIEQDALATYKPSKKW